MKHSLILEKYCIIGAGPGGLCAAVALKRQGIPFDIFDKGRQPGGIWDIGRAETPMYESAHFISSKTLSGFSDFPMPDDYPDYPSHRQLLAYITAYAEKHDLLKYMQFEAEVVHIRPLEAGSAWEVQFKSGEIKNYCGVVCATGVVWHPNLPDYPGTFEGEARHTFTYKSDTELRGRRVLVVGAGNSGVDIACDAARVAEKAFISLRRGYYFVPKYLFGKPADVFAQSGPKLPTWIEVPAYEFLLNRLLVGDLRKYGLPKPDHHVLESHPIMNTQVLHFLGHGDLRAKPDIRELQARSVVFADGSEEEIDLILYATGYRRIFPFIDGEDLPLCDGMHDLYLHIFHRQFDNLFFVGLPEAAGAAYELFGKQAELIAYFVRDQWEQRERVQAFSQMKKTERPDLKGKQRYIDTPRNDFYVQYDRYMKAMARVKKRMKWQ